MRDWRLLAARARRSIRALGFCPVWLIEDLELSSSDLHSLIKSIKRGDVNSIRALIESGTDVDAHTEQGLTPLCIAAISGNTQVLKLLIDAGAEVNKPSLHGFAPLSWAVSSNRTRAAALLREAGAKHEESNFLTEHIKRIYPGIELNLYGEDL